MSPFTFSVVVDGVDDSSDDHLESLSICDEIVMISSIDGVVSIDVCVDAPDEDAAIRRAVIVIELAVAGAVVRRVDLDLVAATDIAERVGVSRQAVGQWVAATSPDPAFPEPLGHVAGGTRVWAWSMVVPWLQRRGRLLDEETLTYDAIVDANALLARPRAPGRLATAGEWRRPEMRTGDGPPTLGVGPLRPAVAGGTIRFGGGDGALAA